MRLTIKHTAITLLFLLATLCLGAQEVKKIKIAALEKIIAESKGPMVINFWATFCKPCIEEIPYFQKLVEAHKKENVQLLLVSLDMKDDYNKIRPFAIKRKFTAPIVWLDETNADYFCPRIDAKWTGGIPATLLINNKKGKRVLIEDQLSEERLEKEIMAILQ